MSDAKEFEKKLAELDGLIERFAAIRILSCYQCIRCRRIFDDIHQAIDHSVDKSCQK